MPDLPTLCNYGKTRMRFAFQKHELTLPATHQDRRTPTQSRATQL